MKYILIILLSVSLFSFIHPTDQDNEYTCLVFEGGFQNTPVKVTVGDSIVYEGILTSNYETGIAKTECISKEILKSSNIELVVDGGKTKVIEPKGYKFIYVNYSKLLISVKHSHHNKHLDY